MRLTTILISGLVAAAAVWAASDTRLADAAMRGDREAVRSLLARHVDVNGAQGDGSTALHWAAHEGDVEMAKMLLKAGANVNAATSVGAITPLYLASKDGNAPIIEALLNAGASANETNANGTTVLMMAAASGDPAAVKALLDHGASVNAVEKANGQTALMFAAALGRADAIKLLIEHGADPKVTTKVVHFEKILVDANGDPIRPPEGAQAAGAGRGRGGRGGADRVFGALMQGGMTALHFAAREGQMKAVEALLAGGANVNEVTAADHSSAINEALINGHYDVAKYLLDHGADPKLANSDGLTPLYATIDMRWRANAWYPQPTVAEEKTGYLDLAKALLAHGADPNARLSRKLWYRKFRYGDDWVDPNGATPFWRAAQADDVAAMKLLLAAGADPKIPTRHGCTALMVAAGIGFEYQLTNLVPDARMAAVKYLAEDLGLDVNAQDVQGYTALHGAAYVGDNDVIKYLISKGADVKAQAKARLFGTQGAQNVPDGKGDTVADMANGPREKSVVHADTLALLVSLGSVNSNDCRSTQCVLNTRPDKPAKAGPGTSEKTSPK